MSLAIEMPPRLLIVDDNPAIHEDIRKILSPIAKNEALDELEEVMFGSSTMSNNGTDFRIDDAYQGQDALQLVMQASSAGNRYDLAIVDMRMPPGWDGVETIEHLWDADPDLQILICTAFSDYSWDEITDRLGLQDKLLILKKPFDDCELLQAVRALGVKRRLLEQSRLSMETLQELVSKRTQELAAAHEESERLLNAISSGLIGYDQDGCVIRWNGAAEHIFQLDASEVLGKPLNQLSINWTNAEQRELFGNSKFRSEGSQLELTLNSKPNERSVLALSVHPEQSGTAFGGGLILADDVTERRRLEQQLQQAQKLESVGQLAAGVAHEINTPIQYIGDNLKFIEGSLQKLEPVLQLLEELLSSPELPAESRETIQKSLGRTSLARLREHLPKAIEDSLQGVSNVARIVQGMKEFSHPGSDSPLAVDLNRALESAVVVSKSEWKYCATVQAELDQSLPAVMGFAQELQQVFLNLLVNAAHAIDAQRKMDTEREGHISITTSHHQQRCQVAIRDNGCGIPEPIRNRIFDPFFTTKEIGKGTGQGLAIAHQVIVNKHGGKLWFESEVGQGTTFFVDLPSACSTGIL